MRRSQTLLPTLKETPADAEIISHQLMLRAGLVRKSAAGLYSWLPLGLRVLRKVEAIIREELDQAGAQELLMPVVQAAELWQESGRWEQYGPELLRIRDRHQRDFCLGPTHEEVITDIVRNDIQSYKQLPLNLYQIQTKFRDEIRPRFGIMRAREFTMKDSYSFHLSQSCLEQTYESMYQAYNRIFTRLGLEFRAVEADTGSIGGSASHEFHVLAESGEDAIAFSNQSDFAANVELAESVLPANNAATVSDADAKPLEEVDTADAKSIDEVCQRLNITAEQTIKTLLVNADPEHGPASGLVALVLRGDHELNDIKAEKLEAVASPLSFASSEEIASAIDCQPGAIGPGGLAERGITVIADRYAAAMTNFCCGANRDGSHWLQANWQRDASYAAVADLRNVQEGDPSPDGSGQLAIRRGIEVGHIFQLGDKYSAALNATVLNEQGKAEVLTMGCYGIGVSRVVAAAIEQHHDDKGICWPEAMAPFDVLLLPLNAKKSELVREHSERLYRELQGAGIDVLLDDSDERPGVKFANAELIGVPHVLVLGEKSLQQGVVEYRSRLTGESEEPALETVHAFLQSKLGIKA